MGLKRKFCYYSVEQYYQYTGLMEDFEKPRVTAITVIRKALQQVYDTFPQPIKKLQASNGGFRRGEIVRMNDDFVKAHPDHWTNGKIGVLRNFVTKERRWGVEFKVPGQKRNRFHKYLPSQLIKSSTQPELPAVKGELKPEPEVAPETNASSKLGD